MQTTMSGTDLELPENEEARRVAIKNIYNVEVRCPECSGIAFYHRGLPVRGRQIAATDCLYSSGQVPTRVDPIAHCESCHNEVPARQLSWRGKSW